MWFKRPKMIAASGWLPTVATTSHSIGAESGGRLADDISMYIAFSQVAASSYG
jgi:hypothetical protein